MPVYDFVCGNCGKVMPDTFVWPGQVFPECCNKPMLRKMNPANVVVKQGGELYISRMEDIHKAQAQKGERLRMIHPKEVVR
jgi:predicted nucleic acid-binding Zn ribbon protein